MTLAVIVYLALLLILFLAQRKLQYVPFGKIQEISHYRLKGFSEIFLTTSDGIKIFAWYKKPDITKDKIILYFHGNAGNMGDRADKFAALSDAGFGVLAISYQGYNKSEGKPSEQGFINNSKAALQFLFDNGYKPNDIILFGESIGSGVAVQLAATFYDKFDFAALFLESPFASIAEVAQQTYWFAPVSLLLKDKFESEKYVGKIKAPILIIHGDKDKIVPIAQGKKLYAAITARKKFIEISGVGHLEFSEEF